MSAASAWLVLLIAGLCEIGWAVGLKYTEGFSRLWPSVGTLVAFVTVSIGVIVLRRRHPDLPRSFKVPFYPVTPILSVLGCLWIIYNLRVVTLYVFVIWCAVAIVWYLVYARSHSHLGKHEHVGLEVEEPQP